MAGLEVDRYELPDFRFHLSGGCRVNEVVLTELARARASELGFAKWWLLAVRALFIGWRHAPQRKA